MSQLFQLVRELWPALVVLFLLEAVGLVGQGHTLYRLRPAGARRMGPGLAFLGFWPKERVIAGWATPPRLAADGVFLLRPGTASAATPFQLEAHEFIPWSELRPLEIEHDKVLCGEKTIKTPSPTHAELLAARLKALRDADETSRTQKLLAEEKSRLDFKYLQSRLNEVLPALSKLELACWAGLALYLVLLPLAAFASESRHLLIALLVTSLACHIALLGFAVRLGRALGRAGWPQPRAVLLPLILSPPALLRSPTALLRPIFTAWDEEALALALLGESARIEFLRRQLHGIQWAADQADESRAGRAWAAFWQSRTENLHRRLAEAGLRADELLELPPPLDPQTLAVCPFCGSEFGERRDACTDCQGPLIALPTPV